MFQPLPSVPDHPGLEREVLDWWEEKQVFDRLRELNRDGPTWSFVDGPITANNPMGVHHCWGRTLKDVFQRYKALQGFDQRYQNGFDCQGLWVEVNVERAARAQLEARDRGVRARRVRREVQAVGGRVRRGDHRPVQAARHVDGLGQRLLHVLGHEHRVHLALPEDGARARVALHGAPLERLVPALRDVHLPARADRLLRGPERPVALRAPAAPRRRRGGARRLDDDALDVAGERRRRRRSRGRVREALDCRRPALGRRGAASRASVRRRGRREGEGGGARRHALRGPVRPPCRRPKRSSTASSRGTT